MVSEHLPRLSLQHFFARKHEQHRLVQLFYLHSKKVNGHVKCFLQGCQKRREPATPLISMCQRASISAVLPVMETIDEADQSSSSDSRQVLSCSCHRNIIYHILLAERLEPLTEEHHIAFNLEYVSPMHQEHYRKC